MAKAKLLKVLDNHKGRDIKLELQRKKEKAAAKKRDSKTKTKSRDEDIEEAEDVDVEAGLEDAAMEGGVQVTAKDEEWEDEEDEDDEDTDDEAEAGFDLSRLDDSDSDSDDDEDDAEISHPVMDILKNFKANGIPKPATTKASASSKSKVPATDDDNEVQPDTELADEDEDDIPLSDLSETGSANEDIIPHQRLTINNTTALTRAHNSIALPISTLPFSEHQSITTSAPVTIDDINDDLNRELAFYSQSLTSVKEARKLLTQEKIPFTRPTDYFAEMVKSDEHMGKIKSKLVDDAANKKAAADARRQRDLKRFGKQVQQEKLQERAKEKKDMMEKVGILKRKRASGGAEETEEGLFDVALEDAAITEKKDKDARKGGARGGRGGSARGGARGGASSRGDGPSNPKRARKDEKFGFGGKKRFSKSGDAKSSSDMSGFSTKKMKGQGASKRLGKARRQKTR